MNGQVINKASNYHEDEWLGVRGVKIYLYKGFLFKSFVRRSEPVTCNY